MICRSSTIGLLPGHVTVFFARSSHEGGRVRTPAEARLHAHRKLASLLESLWPVECPSKTPAHPNVLYAGFVVTSLRSINGSRPPRSEGEIRFRLGRKGRRSQ